MGHTRDTSGTAPRAPSGPPKRFPSSGTGRSPLNHCGFSGFRGRFPQAVPLPVPLCGTALVAPPKSLRKHPVPPRNHPPVPFCGTGSGTGSLLRNRPRLSGRYQVETPVPPPVPFEGNRLVPQRPRFGRVVDPDPSVVGGPVPPAGRSLENLGTSPQMLYEGRGGPR
jgi:hypothetical protein